MVGVSEGVGVNQGGILLMMIALQNFHALAMFIYFTNKLELNTFSLSQKLSMAKQSVSFMTYISKSLKKTQ